MAYMSQEHKSRIAAKLKAVTAGKDIKYSLSVRHHSTIVMTIRSGAYDFIGAYNASIEGKMNYWGEGSKPNTDGRLNYSHRSHMQENFAGAYGELLDAIMDCLFLDYYDRSDSQTDYFDTSHYVELKIGDYDKPYVNTGEAYTPPRAPEIHDPELPLASYDATEVHPCREYCEDGQSYVEQCDRDQAQFWSVYLHLKTGGVECIADFATETEADAHAAQYDDLIASYVAIERRDREERASPSPLAHLDRIAAEQAAYYNTTPERMAAAMTGLATAQEDQELNPTPQKRIILTVSGGCVTDAYGPDGEPVEIVVIDWDDYHDDKASYYPAQFQASPLASLPQTERTILSRSAANDR